MSRTDLSTKEHILHSAERLFAEASYARVSMRAIAAAAGVHLGALPYHFGTKDAIYRAIWEQWKHALDANALLAEARALSDGSLRGDFRLLVKAFFAAPRHLLDDPRGRYFAMILVREANDDTNGERMLICDYIAPNGALFEAAFAALCPHVPQAELTAAFHLTTDALGVVLARNVKQGQVPTAQEAAPIFDVMTDFLVDGWLAVHKKYASGHG